MMRRCPFGLSCFLVIGVAACGDGDNRVAIPRDASVARTDAASHDTGTRTGVTEYYVAIDGDDASSGAIDAPFATPRHALSLAQPGDTVLLRGGTYEPSATLVLDQSGVEGSPIALWAYPGETVVLDFASHLRHSDPPRPRVSDEVAMVGDAFGVHVSGDYWHLRGFTVRNAPYYGVRVYGSNNVFEQLVLHDNKASGLELTGKDGFSPSNNLVLNCDSYRNFDPQSFGEDADGFAAKFDSLGPGNVFRGTRAWSNSDDGYDFWHAANPVVIEDAWAFDNGFHRPEWAAIINGGFQGDGFGFKLGQDAAELVLTRVVAWSNKGFGIDENGNRSAGGLTIEHATLVNNAKDGNPIQIQLNDDSPHTVINSIAFDLDGAGVTDLASTVDDLSNSWNGVGVDASDFVSLDMDTLFREGTAPRGPDGALPTLGLRLAPGSRLIDAGANAGGLVYQGAAPDLGAFEFAP